MLSPLSARERALTFAQHPRSKMLLYPYFTMLAMGFAGGIYGMGRLAWVCCGFLSAEKGADGGAGQKDLLLDGGRCLDAEGTGLEELENEVYCLFADVMCV